MYKFNRILVCLDHTGMDAELIEGACQFCNLSGSKEIFFVHVIRDFSLSEQVQKEFPGLMEKAFEDRKSEIIKKVRDRFSCKGVKTHFEIIKGQPTRLIMNFSSKNDIDLIVVGRKQDKKSKGVMVQRIARRADCSIMIIPKGIKIQMEKIHVPVDFSEHARMAFEKAIELSRQARQKTTILVQNVYHVPVGYHYSGKSFEEFAEIMKGHASKDYDEFTNDLDLEGEHIEVTYTLDKDDDVITSIHQTATKYKANIIFIGAKGRSATTAIFIGSKAEKLIQMDSKIPVLVIRPKGRNAGLIDYLNEL